MVEAGTFDWGNGTFPAMTEPVASYGGIKWWDNFGEYGFLNEVPSRPGRSRLLLLHVRILAILSIGLLPSRCK